MAQVITLLDPQEIDGSDGTQTMSISEAVDLGGAKSLVVEVRVSNIQGSPSAVTVKILGTVAKIAGWNASSNYLAGADNEVVSLSFTSAANALTSASTGVPRCVLWQVAFTGGTNPKADVEIHLYAKDFG